MDDMHFDTGFVNHNARKEPKDLRVQFHGRMRAARP